MRIAVTGASGLIGGHVVRAGVAGGHTVTALLRASSGREALVGLDVVSVAADVLGPVDALTAAVTGAEVVIHTAATFAYGGDAAALHRVAVAGTVNVLDAAAAAGVRRVVVTSSSVVFGYADERRVIDERAGLADPAGQPAYVAAKIAQDAAATARADALGLELVLACPTMSVGGVATTLGPSNAIVTAYLADPMRSTFPGGCNIVAARDVGAGHILLAERGRPGTHYLLGSENLDWSDIHAMIGALTGAGPPRLELSPRIVGLAAAADAWRARLTGAAPATTREQAGMVGRWYWYDHSAAAALGYAPMPARAALIEAVAWLAASPHVSRKVRATLRLHDDVQRFRYAA